MLKAGKVTII